MAYSEYSRCRCARRSDTVVIWGLPLILTEAIIGCVVCALLWHVINLLYYNIIWNIYFSWLGLGTIFWQPRGAVWGLKCLPISEGSSSSKKMADFLWKYKTKPLLGTSRVDHERISITCDVLCSLKIESLLFFFLITRTKIKLELDIYLWPLTIWHPVLHTL